MESIKLKKPKKFEKLSLQEQKMRIVEDAIAQIKSRKLVPKEGVYVRFFKKSTETYFPEKNQSLQDLLVDTPTKCECCAKGALFAACVIETNEVEGKDKFGKQTFIKRKLKQWFSTLELDMIETSFEKRLIPNAMSNYSKFYKGGYTDLAYKCVDFGYKYDTDRKRLLAILNNILKHGEFKP